MTEEELAKFRAEQARQISDETRARLAAGQANAPIHRLAGWSKAKCGAPWHDYQRATTRDEDVTCPDCRALATKPEGEP